MAQNISTWIIHQTRLIFGEFWTGSRAAMVSCRKPRKL